MRIEELENYGISIPEDLKKGVVFFLCDRKCHLLLKGLGLTSQ